MWKDKDVAQYIYKLTITLQINSNTALRTESVMSVCRNYRLKRINPKIVKGIIAHRPSPWPYKREKDDLYR